MFDFDFQNPTRIVFGKDRLKELDALVPKNAKVLILYGKGSVQKYGTLDAVKNNLSGRAVSEFGGIEPNPRFDTLMKAAELVKQEGIDFLLAVGGGSVMDGAKFVSLVSQFSKEKALELLVSGFDSAPMENIVPLGTVLTLPATGSEMNAGGVVTSVRGKLPFRHPAAFPRFSILDPTLTYTLPATQVANGVIDAFVHVTEQYLTFPVDARFQDRTAEGLLKTLIEIGKKTVDEPTDYDARANLVWCATMALNGLLAAGVPQDWTSHMIGHELTAMFGIDHGKTLAVIAPSVWTVLKDQKRAKLLQFAERVWDITSGDDESKINQAVEKTRAFFETLGIETRLSKYGVGPDKIDPLVAALKEHGFTALSETGAVTPEISKKIIQDAM